MRLRFQFAVLAFVIALAAVSAAADLPVDVAVQQSRAGESQPIQDNSFLVEEAYNQEFGVVQHINTFMRTWNTHDWVYTFTQEWPVPGQKHQLSYTLSFLNSSSVPGSGPGIGDVAINYRYQWIGSGDTRLACSPRITLLAPTGDSNRGRGFGGVGLQTNIPVSWAVNKHLVTHWNAGATFVPSAKNELGQRAGTNGYNLGQSFIWLARPRFNVMLETVWIGSESVVGRGQTQRSHDLLISPGVRWAHNLKNGLQIVPGVGVPLGVGPSAGDKGLFVYLSFEHPFRAIPSDK
mgnify:CR=1 FL=1